MIDFVRREHRAARCTHLPCNHLYTRHHVEEQAESRETLAHVVERIRNLPTRRRRLMESVVKLEPIERAAEAVVLPVAKAKKWRRQEVGALRATRAA